MLLFKNLYHIWIKNNIKHLGDITDYIFIVHIGELTFTFTSLDTHIGRFMKNTSLKKIKDTLDLLDEHYYNSTPLVKDITYDTLSDYYYNQVDIEKSEKIGNIPKKNKVILPIHLGSMDKLKPGQKNLTKFLTKYTNNKVISSKLDGISMLIGKHYNEPVAYTRGDGICGQDISRFLKYIITSKNITLDKILNTIPNDTYIRGEIIISKPNWNLHSDLGSNARNAVMGIMNRKEVTDNIKFCRFLAYEYISSEHLRISEQFKKLEDLEIDTPIYNIYENCDVTEDTLPNIIDEYKKHSDYEIDGIIIQDDIYYKRNIVGNPKYAKAFKMEKYNESGISRIKHIEWTITKNGTLKPIIHIEPIHLKDVVIKKVYAYNAKYIKENKLGKDSTIEIVRSGDVIPKVKEIIKSSFDINIDFPKKYIWNMTQVNIKVADLNNREVIVSQLEYFFKTIKIEFCKKSTINKLYDMNCRRIEDILKMKDTTLLLTCEGIKTKAANKIWHSIQTKLQNVTEDIFISSLPCFNSVSKKRIGLILDNIPQFYTLDDAILYTKICEIKGFSDKIANIIVEGKKTCKYMIDVYGENYGKIKIKSLRKNTNTIYSNYNVCFSGVRDKELEDKIVSNGGNIVSSISNITTHLIVKDIYNKSSKIKKAKIQKIPIIKIENFINILSTLV